jgi:uncharacterized membrane protein
MKGMISFLKTTIIGGVIFLVPVILVVIVLAKALPLVRRIAAPMAGFLPVDTVAGVTVANIISFTILALICFLAGLIARTSLASRAVQKAEARFLWQLPGYAFVKGMTDSFISQGDSSSMRPVSCQLDDSWQIGFEVERMQDGRVVVYLPGAPNPWTGSLLLIDPARVEALNATMVETVGALRKLGHGSSRLFSGNVRQPGAAQDA